MYCMGIYLCIVAMCLHPCGCDILETHRMPTVVSTPAHTGLACTPTLISIWVVGHG